jgi:outer membrane biosynthesis protein TonB
MEFRLESSTALAALAALLILLATDVAWAQQPTPEQTSAIRASCRSDFMANCSGVTPGGKDALECLKRNLAKLSGACQTAVSAVTPAAAPPAAAAPPPAPAASAPSPTPAAAPAMAPPTAPKPATAAAPKPTPKPTVAVTPTPPPAPAAAAAPGFPPLGPVRPMLPQRALVIKAICRVDAQTLCPGAPPIGSAVLSCLAENGPRLSPECYRALVPVTR